MMHVSDRRTHSPVDQKIQKSLSACWKDGVASQIMATVVDTYLVPFGLLLGATNQEIGWLVAVPNLLASLTQAWSVNAVNRAGSRLKILVDGVFIQAFFLLPIGFLAFFPIPQKLLVLTIFVSVYKVVGGVLGPAWGSLVSDYLPAHRRGDYFGWRSRILGITSLVSLMFWGGFLFAWKKWASAETGFLTMFLVAAIARFVSCYLISLMAEQPVHKTKDDDFTLWMFLRRFRESNFVKFVLYVSGITFATHISAPYFSVHMLRDLHFNYLSYMAITLCSTFTSLISFRIWGRHADVVGNARILKTTSFLIPIIPIFWVFLHELKWLVFVELFAGFVWGGFNLCAVNYIYDAVSPAKRVRCIGYFNLINGLAIFSGSLLGGWLGTHLTPIFGYPLLGVFLISSAGRFLAHFFLSGKFQEVRGEVRHVSSSKLFFSVVGFQPMIGRNNETNVLTPGVQFGSKPR